jgi:hypothetical protein
MESTSMKRLGLLASVTAACFAAVLAGNVQADQSVSGQVLNPPPREGVIIRLQSARAVVFYETTSQLDGSWIVRSVSSGNYTVTARRQPGSTLGICFTPQERTITVSDRDVMGVIIRADWPRESCPSAPEPKRTVSGVVLGLQGSDTAAITAQGRTAAYSATTGVNGVWRITDMESDVYAVSAGHPNYVIVPPSITVDATRNDVRNASFRAQKAKAGSSGPK